MQENEKKNKQTKILEHMITKICIAFLIVFVEVALCYGIYAATRVFKNANVFKKDEEIFFKIFSVLIISFFSFVAVILPFLIIFKL